MEDNRLFYTLIVSYSKCTTFYRHSIKDCIPIDSILLLPKFNLRIFNYCKRAKLLDKQTAPFTPILQPNKSRTKLYNYFCFCKPSHKYAMPISLILLFLKSIDKTSISLRLSIFLLKLDSSLSLSYLFL